MGGVNFCVCVVGLAVQFEPYARILFALMSTEEAAIMTARTAMLALR